MVKFSAFQTEITLTVDRPLLDSSVAARMAGATLGLLSAFYCWVQQLAKDHPSLEIPVAKGKITLHRLEFKLRRQVPAPSVVLARVPIEIFQAIAGFMPPKSLPRLALVNKGFMSVAHPIYMRETLCPSFSRRNLKNGIQGLPKGISPSVIARCSISVTAGFDLKTVERILSSFSTCKEASLTFLTSGSGSLDSSLPVFRMIDKPIVLPYLSALNLHIPDYHGDFTRLPNPPLLTRCLKSLRLQTDFMPRPFLDKAIEGVILHDLPTLRSLRIDFPPSPTLSALSTIMPRIQQGDGLISLELGGIPREVAQSISAILACCPSLENLSFSWEFEVGASNETALLANGSDIILPRLKRLTAPLQDMLALVGSNGGRSPRPLCMLDPSSFKSRNDRSHLLTDTEVNTLVHLIHSCSSLHLVMSPALLKRVTISATALGLMDRAFSRVKTLDLWSPVLAESAIPFLLSWCDQVNLGALQSVILNYNKQEDDNAIALISLISSKISSLETIKLTAVPRSLGGDGIYVVPKPRYRGVNKQGSPPPVELANWSAKEEWLYETPFVPPTVLEESERWHLG